MAPIRLQIAGADVLLSGRFEHWVPVVLSEASEGPSAVQILCDVTSNRASRTGTRELFSFKSKSVQAAGPQAYRLKGTLSARGTQAEVEGLLQNPPGHTPFFVVTFQLEPTAFPDLWKALEEGATRVESSGQQELRPRAWLREPNLAAA